MQTVLLTYAASFIVKEKLKKKKTLPVKANLYKANFLYPSANGIEK